jgi:hypothetical protein
VNGAPAAANAREIVASAWQDQAVWSETAGRLKADISSWRFRAGAAGVAGALLETLAGSLPASGGEWASERAAIALVGAVVLAVVPYVLKTKTSRERVRDWVRARCISEALKEAIYRYLVKAPPFAAGAPPSELIRRCREVKEKGRDLSGHAAAVEPARRERPLELTLEAYVEKRVNDQIERYYLPKGRANARTAARLHRLEFWLGLAAAALGALAGAAASGGLPVLARLGPWVAVVTTAGGAVTAHLAAGRYDHAAMTYFGTADRLKGLRDEWLAEPGRLEPGRAAKFVDDCEHAISTENEAWLAEWTLDAANP